MKFLKNGLIYDTEKSKLLFSKERETEFFEGFYMGDFQYDYYATKKEKFFQITTSWQVEKIPGFWNKVFDKERAKFIPKYDIVEFSLKNMCDFIKNAPLEIQNNFAKKYLKEA